MRLKKQNSPVISFICSSYEPNLRVCDETHIWCNNVVDNSLLDFLAGLTAVSPVTG